MRLLIVSHHVPGLTSPLSLLSARPLLPLANAAETPALLGAANAIAIGEDGWALIPYGDTVHNGANAEKANGLAEVKGQPGIIQRFTRERALAMANAFHSLRGKIKRAIVGMDIYKGHPDCAAFANFFPDKAARGAIADMQAREDGLAFKPVLNERGVADVEDGWDHFSPFWYGELTGEQNGVKIYEPVRLKSIGLVGGAGSRHMRGNIPGLSLVNADPVSLPTETTMKKILELLAKLGVTVPADPAPTLETLDTYLDQALTAAGGMMPKKEADEAKAKVEGELAAANARATAAEAKAGSAETALANARTESATALQTVRSAAAGAVVTAAIAAGRVPAAERDTQVLALVNASDFGAAAAALAAKPAKLPTQSRLGDLGATGKEQGDRQTQLLGLVNAHMDTAKCSYDEAFAAVSGTEKGKALLGAMKRPEKTAAK